MSNKLGNYDIWYKPCEKCGYDTARSSKERKPTCWKCGGYIYRDYSDRALKATKRINHE